MNLQAQQLAHDCNAYFDLLQDTSRQLWTEAKYMRSRYSASKADNTYSYSGRLTYQSMLLREHMHGPPLASADASLLAKQLSHDFSRRDILAESMHMVAVC